MFKLRGFQTLQKIEEISVIRLFSGKMNTCFNTKEKDKEITMIISVVHIEDSGGNKRYFEHRDFVFTCPFVVHYFYLNNLKKIEIVNHTVHIFLGIYEYYSYICLVVFKKMHLFHMSFIK